MVDFNFDPTSDRESTGFDLINEPGPFPAHIVNVEEKQTNGAKGIGTMFSFTWEIIEGDFQGAKIFQNLNLDNPSKVAVSIAQNDLRSVCNAIGHKEGFRGDAREALTVLMHRPVRITLAVRNYTDKNGNPATSNEIAREGKVGPLFVYPYSEAPQVATQRQAVQQQATPRPAVAPAGAQSLKTKPDFMLRKEAAERAASQSGDQIPY